MEPVCSFDGQGSLLTLSARFCVVVRLVGTISYTPRPGICLIVASGGESILHALSWHLFGRPSG